MAIASRTLFQQSVDDLVAHLDEMSVLEAGCGALSRVEFRVPTHVTGLDISQRQLDRNDELDIRILGDVESYPLPRSAYDLIISWDVLEHLSNPGAAVENLTAALKPGGIVILAIPNLYSVKGIVTKLTPFSFHLFFYRHIVKGKYVDTDQRNQFPTYLRHDIAPGRLQDRLRRHGCDIRFLHLYEGPLPTRLRAKYRLFDWMSRAGSFVSRTLTFGRVDLTHSDLLLIAQKR